MSDLFQLGVWGALLVKLKDGLSLTLHHCLCSAVKKSFHKQKEKKYRCEGKSSCTHLLARLVEKT